MKAEELIKKQLSTYMQLQYPDIIFRFDIAADIRFSIGQAVKSKSIHKHNRGFPDLIIFEKKGEYGALFLEIKTDFSKVYNKNGELKKNKHVEEQTVFLQKLEKKGYRAMFCFGFDDCKKKIDDFLKT